MAAIMILARVRLPGDNLDQFQEYWGAAKAALAEVPGFIGMSAWQRSQRANSFLLAYQYASVESAEEGLVALTRVRLLAEQPTNYQPADVLRVLCTEAHGKLPHETPNGSYLSVSDRIADPGYGDELDAEIERIFEELRLMDGFLGSYHGPNDSLPEEIVGLALWSSEAAFARSIPPTKRDYEVHLYRKLD